MKQTPVEQDETLIRKILSALAWNKIDMGLALIETDRATPQKLKEIDRFLQQHNGEITEEQFKKIV